MNKLLIILIFAISISAQTAIQTPQPSPTPVGANTAKTDKDLQQQKKKFKFDERYVVSYDKFEDQTIVRCIGFNMIGTMEGAAEIVAKGMGGYGRNPVASILYFGVGFIFKSDTLKEEPANYFLYFNYKGDEWKFLKNSKLIVLLDGDTRIQFGEGEADRNVGRFAVSEVIGFRATKEQIQQMANAKTIEVKIGNYAKPLKKESQEMFANILKLGDLSQRADEKKKDKK